MQQLSEDKLPEEVRRSLDGVAGDTTKIAVLLMMEQHLGRVGLICFVAFRFFPKDFVYVSS